MNGITSILDALLFSTTSFAIVYGFVGQETVEVRCLTSSRHRLAPGLRHATTAHTLEMCKEALASAVLRLSLALPFLVLCFSLPVSSLVLCLPLHHLAPARKSQKRLPLRTTKARTTNEFAF
jgi:hypothetical protein